MPTWLDLLIDHEVTFRYSRRLSRRLAAAKLRQAATVEESTIAPLEDLIVLSSSLFRALTTSQWVREHNHLAIIGHHACLRSLPKLAVRGACRAR